MKKLKLRTKGIHYESIFSLVAELILFFSYCFDFYLGSLD